MSKEKSMKWYREQINFGLEKSRSRVLHQFIFDMICAYYHNHEKIEKNLQSLFYEEEGKA